MAQNLREQILSALSEVEDPDLKKDLVTLNMIRDLEVNHPRVQFKLILTTPACPLKDILTNACKTAIKTLVSDELEVEIEVGSQVSSSRSDRTLMPGVRNIIAIASGKGGVGKSTVAVELARSLNASGAKIGLLDADIHGPSVPTLLGIENEKPRSEGDKMQPVDFMGIKVISIGFIVPKEQAVVWRGPMLSNAFKQLSADVNWGELDYLIIDLPPGTGDVHLSLIQQIPLSGVLIVTNPEEVSIADARKAMSMFKMPQLQTRILGIVENMSYFEAEGTKYHLFGEGGAERLSNEFEVEVLAKIPVYEYDKRILLREHFDVLSGELVRRISVMNASN